MEGVDDKRDYAVKFYLDCSAFVTEAVLYTPCFPHRLNCPPRLKISQTPQQASALTAGRQFRCRKSLRVSCRKLRRCAMARPRSFKMPRGGHCHHAL